MLTLLGTIFGSIFSGGATGLIGIVLQRFADFKNKQLDMQLEAQRHLNNVALRRVDAEIMAQEWAARTKVAEVEAAGKVEVADAAAFAASYAMDNQRYSDKVKPTVGQGWVFVLLDAFRGIVRPALTLYLCVLVTAVYIEARMKLNVEDLSPDQALELFKLMLGSIIYVWTTVTLWWFGTRNKQDQPKVG